MSNPSSNRAGWRPARSRSASSTRREDFLRYFAFPALAAGAIYQDEYPLATALARPLMAKLLVDVAHEEGADAVAHGCTGKGNDQVRFDVGIQTLDPSLKIVAPTRENAMARDYQIEYLKKHGVDIPWGDEGPVQHRREHLGPERGGRRPRRPVGRTAG